MELQSPVIRENRETCSGCTRTTELDILQPSITRHKRFFSRFGSLATVDM